MNIEEQINEIKKEKTKEFEDMFIEPARGAVLHAEAIDGGIEAKGEVVKPYRAEFEARLAMYVFVKELIEELTNLLTQQREEAYKTIINDIKCDNPKSKPNDDWDRVLEVTQMARDGVKEYLTAKYLSLQREKGKE